MYYDALSEGIAKGFKFFGKITIDTKELAKQLKNNIARFSAFKEESFNKALLNLINQNGILPTRKEFMADARKIDQLYNRDWLNTEFDFTVAKAQSALQWKDYESRKHLYPNIRYVAIHDGRSRALHLKFDGLVLPMEHDFWKTHLPPWDYGCRCGTEQTDDEEFSPEGLELDSYKPKPGMGVNPGLSGKIIADDHPYYKVGKGEIEGIEERLRRFETEKQAKEDYATLNNSPLFMQNLDALSGDIKAAYPNIDIEKINAVNMYSGFSYREINLFNRGVLNEYFPEFGATKDFYAALTRTINNALDEIPDKFAGIAYRGTTLTRKQMKPYIQALKTGKPHKELAFMSSSYEKCEVFDGNVKLIVQSKNGTMIEKVSEAKREKEVLFKAGQEFRVTKIDEFDGDVWDVYIEQV